jgi:hypothetical protein
MVIVFNASNANTQNINNNTFNYIMEYLFFKKKIMSYSFEEHYNIFFSHIFFVLLFIIQ